ncbi:hypothetical protein C7271_02660 [filamentous cyanobacterium CCP5]|nr:hypothetical protein C7271_02660 [filamentous cyanobacterium CCP5]
MSSTQVNSHAGSQSILKWLTTIKLIKNNPDLHHLVIALNEDKELKTLLNQVSQETSNKILALMFLELKTIHPEYAPYFESLLRIGQSKPNLSLLIQTAQWLSNQPEEFHIHNQKLLEKNELSSSFYKALRLWGDQLILQQAQDQSNIRELYLNELFPDIKNVQVPVGVIHEESHHPNQVDMLYVCAIATVMGAKRIFEFGTYRGQTTCGLAAIAPDVSVYTLNLPPDQDPRYAPYIGSFIKASPYKDRVHQLFADSTQFETTEFAHSMDYVFIDADHSYEGVKNDTIKALEMLKPGGTIVWHDYAAKSPGVYRYIQEFSAERPVFRIRNTCLIVYRDGVSVEQFEPATMLSSLENAEYTPEKQQRAE